MEFGLPRFIILYFAGVFLRGHWPDIQSLQFARSFHSCCHRIRLHLGFSEHSISAYLSEGGFFGFTLRRAVSRIRGRLHVHYFHMESLRFAKMIMPYKLAGVRAARTPELIEMIQVYVSHRSGSARWSLNALRASMKKFAFIFGIVLVAAILVAAGYWLGFGQRFMIDAYSSTALDKALGDAAIRARLLHSMDLGHYDEARGLLRSQLDGDIISIW